MSQDQAPPESNRPVSPMQTLSLGMAIGLFLTFLLTTLLLVKFLNRPQGLADDQLFGSGSVPGSTAPVFLTKPVGDGSAKSRHQVSPSEVNLMLALDGEVTKAEITVGQFYNVLLLWTVEGGAVMQDKIINVEVVALDSASPPDRPKPTATLRLRRRDAEQFQQCRARPGFRYHLEPAGR